MLPACEEASARSPLPVMPRTPDQGVAFDDEGHAHTRHTPAHPQPLGMQPFPRRSRSPLLGLGRLHLIVAFGDPSAWLYPSSVPRTPAATGRGLLTLGPRPEIRTLRRFATFAACAASKVSNGTVPSPTRGKG